MENLLEFFYNLLMLVWNNLGTIVTPILNFISMFAEFAITILSNALTWIVGAIGSIIEVFTNIGDFFGISFNPFDGVGGGHGGGGVGGR